MKGIGGIKTTQKGLGGGWIAKGTRVKVGSEKKGEKRILRLLLGVGGGKRKKR